MTTLADLLEAAADGATVDIRGQVIDAGSRECAPKAKNVTVLGHPSTGWITIHSPLGWKLDLDQHPGDGSLWDGQQQLVNGTVAGAMLKIVGGDSWEICNFALANGECMGMLSVGSDPTAGNKTPTNWYVHDGVLRNNGAGTPVGASGVQFHLIYVSQALDDIDQHGRIERVTLDTNHNGPSCKLGGVNGLNGMARRVDTTDLTFVGAHECEFLYVGATGTDTRPTSIAPIAGRPQPALSVYATGKTQRTLVGASLPCGTERLQPPFYSPWSVPWPFQAYSPKFTGPDASNDTNTGTFVHFT